MKDAIVIVWCSNELQRFGRYKVDQQIPHEISIKVAIESHGFVYSTLLLIDILHDYNKHHLQFHPMIDIIKEDSQFCKILNERLAEDEAFNLHDFTMHLVGQYN